MTRSPGRRTMRTAVGVPAADEPAVTGSNAVVEPHDAASSIESRTGE